MAVSERHAWATDRAAAPQACLRWRACPHTPKTAPACRTVAPQAAGEGWGWPCMLPAAAGDGGGGVGLAPASGSQTPRCRAALPTALEIDSRGRDLGPRAGEAQEEEAQGGAHIAHCCRGVDRAARRHNSEHKRQLSVREPSSCIYRDGGVWERQPWGRKCSVRLRRGVSAIVSAAPALPQTENQQHKRT